MSEFVHLHVHSDYSLLRGAAPVKKLIERAKSLGMPALALTDDGNMFGALEFYKAARKAGIKPIIGCDFYLSPGSRFSKSGSETGSRTHRLVLLARNETGYRNLMKLTSQGYTEGFYYKPRIDRELVAEHSDGLIGLSGSFSGEVPSLIRRNRLDEAKETALWYRDTLGEGNFYLELLDNGIPEQKSVNAGLIDLSQETGIPLVAANDCYYVEREDANAQDVLMCIGSNKKKNDTARFRFSTDQFYLKTSDEMRELFKHVPEALENSATIAQACQLEIDLPGPRFPDYHIPDEFESADAYLKDLTYRGLAERYDEVTEELRTRADYELDTIISMGFTGYFLIVWDFIKFARDNGIPVGPGRGSGAGSIVAYALQITDIDPIAYGLLFERFLNSDRVSMPDFDIDFCFERRGEVIEYVNGKYGRDKVGQIITFGTLKAKAVIRDVARVLDIPYSEADAIAKLVPGGPKVTLEGALGQEPQLRELQERGGVYGELMETALKLEGLHRHASTHAAGIVIGNEELTSYVPLYRDPKTASISTQYTMDQLEDCGLVKMDFLGLKTLTLIKNTEALVRRKIPDFDIETVSDVDPQTFKMLGEGKSAAVFQFESQGMQSILARAKPERIEDLIALNALYRPGPMENIDQFVDSKNGRTAIRYPLPELEPILKETYGVIVYQEQVMEIVQVVAGFSLGQADILRRAMGKKKVEAMAKMKADFLAGAQEKSFSRKQAEGIFVLLQPFAGYGFNKSHAAAYSVLAYKTAYLKANHPAEFMAANLTNEINDPKKFAWYMEETLAMGIELRPPDINLSEKYFTVADGKIVYGLMGIKNVGSAAVDEILRERTENGPFTGFEEFLERVDLKTVNRKVIEMGIQSGLFDSIFESRATLFHNLALLLEHAVRKVESRKYGQTSLFDQHEEELQAVQLESVAEWSNVERLQYEKENLGFYFSGHPLDDYRERWQKTVSADLSSPERTAGEKKYNLLGMLKSVRVIQTRNNTQMAFAVLEDFNGSIELVFFDEPFTKYRNDLVEGSVIGVVGTFERRRDNIQVVVEEVKRPEDLEEKEANEIHIRLEEEVDNPDKLYRLRGFLFDRSGGCPVYLHVRRNGDEIVIRASAQLTVSSRRDVLEEIGRQPGVCDVWKQ